MHINDKELSYLLDIYYYCNIVHDIVKTTKYYHFEKNKPMQMAVERGIMIVGEASNRLSDETQKNFPNIPWRDIIGMRNRIVHEYGELQISLMWRTAKVSVPKLLIQIGKIKQLRDYLDDKSGEH
jgi:uncharacterized protein with HEPN domain